MDGGSSTIGYNQDLFSADPWLLHSRAEHGPGWTATVLLAMANNAAELYVLNMLRGPKRRFNSALQLILHPCLNSFNVGIKIPNPVTHKSDFIWNLLPTL